MSKYIPGNQKHLSLEDRKYIERSLNLGTSFKDIARFLCKDPTTISKEVKLHRLSDWYHKGTFYNAHNFWMTYNNIVVINDIRFKGKRSVDWKDVREYLKEYVGEFYTIASTGDAIYIGSDLPKEYSGSKYTNSIKGTNAKAKANAATGIPEMIEIAVGKHFRENHEDQHKRDAKNGWYRYDSRFALPVYDDKCELERYNVFHASMLVRHSNDGKLYLYDVIDIKKETSNSIGE